MFVVIVLVVVATGVSQNITTELTTITMTTESLECTVNDSCADVGKNTTIVDLTTQATTTPTKLTTIPIETTVKPNLPEKKLKQPSSSVCFCNLQRHVCDVNCCCDGDCSSQAKEVFHHCEEEQNRFRDTRFCKYIDYIYTNNTGYEWEAHQNGLFCIVKSNAPPQYVVQEKLRIRNIDDVIMQKRNRYEWPVVDLGTIRNEFILPKILIYGDPIWIKQGSVVKELAFPASFVTDACLRDTQIKYLNNYKSSCIQQLDEGNPALNAEHYYKDVTIINAFPLQNYTLDKKIVNIKDIIKKYCPKDICLPFSVKFCDDKFEKCSNSTKNVSKPSCRISLFKNTNDCLFLTQKVRYNFYHNGTKGFARVDLYLVLRNGSFPISDEDHFVQTFEANFFWFNHTLNYSNIMSGNPGYLHDKMILLGNLITIVNSTNTTEIIKKIQRNHLDVADNFLVFPKNEDGFCVLSNSSYTPVEFGTHTMFKCHINEKLSLNYKALSANATCRRIQLAILKYWSMPLQNVSKVVGIFGNANENILTDWEEIIFERTPENLLNSTYGYYRFNSRTIVCFNVTFSINVNIFHARYDTKTYQNQEKIVGTAFMFDKGNAFEFSLGNNSVLLDLPLNMRVWFFDVTKPKIKKFVGPPKFRIRLPYDFFYPFVRLDNVGCQTFALKYYVICAFVLLCKLI